MIKVTFHVSSLLADLPSIALKQEKAMKTNRGFVMHSLSYNDSVVKDDHLEQLPHPSPLLQRNETRRVSSTNTRPSMLNRFAR